MDVFGSRGCTFTSKNIFRIGTLGKENCSEALAQIEPRLVVVKIKQHIATKHPKPKENIKNFRFPLDSCDSINSFKWGQLIKDPKYKFP
jgi:hypothetical protein